MKEYDFDILRLLTLIGKVFQIFSFQECKNQLRLIDSYYNGYKNLISEFLKVGASDEFNPLYLFSRAGVTQHLGASSWSLRALFETRVLSSLIAGQQRDNIIE